MTKGLETLAAMEEVETTRDGIFVSDHALMPSTLAFQGFS